MGIFFNAVAGLAVVNDAVDDEVDDAVDDKLSQLTGWTEDTLPPEPEPVTTILFVELSFRFELQLLLLDVPLSAGSAVVVCCDDVDEASLAVVCDEDNVDDDDVVVTIVVLGVGTRAAKFSGFICMEPKLMRCKLPVVWMRTRMGGWRQPRADRARRIMPRAPPTFCPA